MIVDIPHTPGAQIALPEEFDRLYDIANNLWWAWDDEASELWARIDAQRWHDVQNPISFLQGVEPTTWESLSADARFIESYSKVVRRFDSYMAADDTWFEDQNFEMPGPIAYLCTEYGLQTRLPFYSGGLGVLAGDHLKTASDLGIPMLAVGLLYRRGYFRQAVDPGGGQQHYYPALDISRRPIHPIVGRGGSQLQVELDFPGRSVMATAWKLQVGRVPLIMLDTDVAENDPADRTITHHLYVRGRDMRLAQELVLGVGAVKVLRKLEITPAAWHVNEGHAAFSVLERTARRLREGTGFDEAQRQVRAKTLFTLHTPVPAGNERFDLGAVQRYTDYLFPEIDAATIAKLGRANEHDEGAFDMGALAIRFASYVNGVSARHGEVATQQWSHLIGGPADSVTNGVHVPTWIGHSINRVFTEAVGTDWPSHLTAQKKWEAIRDVPDDELWHAHLAQKNAMTRQVRRRQMAEFSRHGASPDVLREVRDMLPADRLTIGFARRFATYKRANLLLHHRDTLEALLADDDRPIQFVFAGKAHPADKEGKALLAEIVAFAKTRAANGRFVFLPDYEMAVARAMYAGCDVWLNTPIRPHEACGTSGEKAALNGGLNCSISDGWWDEMADDRNGWTIPDSLANRPGRRDREESAVALEIISSEILPTYYGDGVP
ncbi:MAG: alpha-glucan family phosphorylase, partial [Acidimicrobiia bacterium]|nr:alpha-glucan family phosphorylase [Acidimicrobiia bacterium]